MLMRPQQMTIRWVLAVAIICVLSALSALPASANPKPTKSKYAEDLVAGFAVGEGEIFYSVKYHIKDAVPRPVFAVVEFQNPSDRKAPFLVRADLTSGDELAVESKPFKAIKNNKNYRVVLKLYADAERTDRIGVHKSKVRFSLPPPLAAQVGIELL